MSKPLSTGRRALVRWALARLGLAYLGLVGLTACANVEPVNLHFYRLDPPSPSGGELWRAGPLRIESIRLAAHLTGDGLVVARGPVAFEPYRYHLWGGSLDGLVLDALAAGLSRSHAFAAVFEPADAGREELRLTGKLLEFEHELGDEDSAGRVGLRLRLHRVTGELLLDEEFHERVSVVSTDGRAEDVVAALSEGIGRIIDRLLNRAEAIGVFRVEVDATPGR